VLYINQLSEIGVEMKPCIQLRLCWWRYIREVIKYFDVLKIM